MLKLAIWYLNGTTYYKQTKLIVQVVFNIKLIRLIMLDKSAEVAKVPIIIILFLRKKYLSKI